MSLDDMQDKIEHLQFRLGVAEASMMLLVRSILDVCDRDVYFKVHEKYTELLNTLDVKDFLKK